MRKSKPVKKPNKLKKLRSWSELKSKRFKNDPVEALEYIKAVLTDALQRIKRITRG